VKIHGNDLDKPISRSVTRDLFANKGYTTENAGVATLQPGHSEVQVLHGLAIPPLVSGIHIAPIGRWSVSEWFIAEVAATHFTIRANAKALQPMSFSWQARVRPA
jgi:hypothetical protein